MDKKQIRAAKIKRQQELLDAAKKAGNRSAVSLMPLFFRKGACRLGLKVRRKLICLNGKTQHSEGGVLGFFISKFMEAYPRSRLEGGWDTAGSD